MHPWLLPSVGIYPDLPTSLKSAYVNSGTHSNSRIPNMMIGMFLNEDQKLKPLTLKAKPLSVILSTSAAPTAITLRP